MFYKMQEEMKFSHLFALLLVFCGFSCIKSYQIMSPSLKLFDAAIDLGTLNTTCPNNHKTIYVNRALVVPWVTANLVCQDYGMQLLTIADEVEQNAILQLLEDKYCEFFIV